MNKIKGILYDFDGTIVDSEKFHFESWKQTLDEFGIQLIKEYYLLNYAGVPTPQNAKTMINKYRLAISSKNLCIQREFVAKRLAKEYQLELMPNALETIKYFHSKGIRLGIVTGSPRVDLDDFFEYTSIEKYFDFSITRDDVEKSKPNPQCYFLGASKLGFKKSEIIVFEDTHNGVLAAKNANLTCYAVQKEKILQERLSKADKIFSTLGEAKEYLTKNNN